MPSYRYSIAKPRESNGLPPIKYAATPALLPAKEVEALKLKADSAEQEARASKELAQKALQYVSVLTIFIKYGKYNSTPHFTHLSI